MFRRILVVGALLASTVALTACENTIRGAGRDLSETGQATQDAMADIAE